MENRNLRSFVIFIITIYILSSAGISLAQSTCTTNVSGDAELFAVNASPNALILLDLSGSMNWTPAGQNLYISSSQNCWSGSNVPYYASSGTGHTNLCQADPYTTSQNPTYGDTNCVGPFYFNSGTGHTTNCSRVAMAKRAIFSILDADSSGTIDNNDYCTLNVRFGFMRFTNVNSDSTNGNDTAGNYKSGNIQLIWPFSTSSTGATPYQSIYCNNTTSCASTVTACSGSTECVVGETAKTNSGTPLASALTEALSYLNDAKNGANGQPTDPYTSCRQSFVIVITDGSDTFACNGDGTETQSDQYKRRRASVAATQALNAAGYKVFVVGMGADEPEFLQNTLNWMAYFGGTDNPNITNAGVTTAYNPSAVTSCQTSSTTTTCNDSQGSTGAPQCATSNDPGTAYLRGYAFLTSDANGLNTALSTAIQIIRAANYSFSQASVQATRTQDENYIYEASFDPIAGAPFWHGHLKKYTINADGTLGSLLYDAGPNLQSIASTSRNIWTCKSGSCTFTPPNFTTAIITAADLNVADTTHRDDVVGYIRGDPGSATQPLNPDCSPMTVPCAANTIFKLGDLFDSAPVVVGTPNPYFDDIRDVNNAFAMFRQAHCRESSCPSPANNNRIILAGGNDGQLHSFYTNSLTEAWSFIPPNLLPLLKNIAHTANPTGLAHQFFVDGPLTTDNVWLGTGNGTSKNYLDWHTILVLAEGRGGSSAIPASTLWSSVSTCDSSFSPVYYNTTTGIYYPYYCGYHALDVSNTLSPTFMWHLGGSNPLNTTKHAPYLGDPWSQVLTGRVLINGNETWVGFIGAGYNTVNCSGGGTCSDTRGKGFFVFSLKDGSILWSYTYSDNSNVASPLPAAAALVDLDNDGFIDTAYIGDLGGNIWRFTFCRAVDGLTCNTNNWKGGRLFSGSTADPVYTIPNIVLDGAQNLWVFWGTGDITDPENTSKGGKIFALKDNNRNIQQPNYNISNLKALTGSTTCDSTCASNYNGYYITMTKTGEKVLANPTVFNGVLYFTSFVPTGSLCDQGGDAYLYALQYTSGAGAFSGGTMSTKIGEGIASAPTLSLAPPSAGQNIAVDLYVTVSGGSGTGFGGVAGSNASGGTFSPGYLTGGGAVDTIMSPVNILFWKDRRIQ